MVDFHVYMPPVEHAVLLIDICRGYICTSLNFPIPAKTIENFLIITTSGMFNNCMFFVKLSNPITVRLLFLIN